MTIEQAITEKAVEGFQTLYGQSIDANLISLQKTKKEFEGELTLVVFPLLRYSGKKPEDTGAELGAFLVNELEEVDAFQVVKGFLNLTISDDYWIGVVRSILKNEQFGQGAPTGKTMMVEYSSPNTNKPLHLGHLRNNFLGYSVSRILEANGHDVVKVQIINDKGIHICKSMLAWQKFGHGETPESAGVKGDKLVGKYYVTFDQHYKKEIAALVQEKKTDYPALAELAEPAERKKELEKLGKSMSDEQKAELKDIKALLEFAERNAPLILEAQEMLRKWEGKDLETVALWEKMNNWVYDGFGVTYEKMNVSFDKLYYESDTYLLGKERVQHGLERGIFYQKEDGSIWCDLTDEGLDQKLLLRGDGTSVYMTQDIGTAHLRFEDYPDLSGLIYTVGDEQEYHFKVLFLILKKLGYSWWEGCHHLSYGMVDLPSGKMKSREGTVVDADDLIQDITDAAADMTRERGKLDDVPEAERQELYATLGLGALKYFILKVDPQRRMLFNPEESVAINGDTGPFIQYSYARTQSILRRGKELLANNAFELSSLHPKEKNLVLMLNEFPQVIKEAGAAYSPALVANYVYEVAKEYNQFFHDVPIFPEQNEDIRKFRVLLSGKVGDVIRYGMDLLGIRVPQRM